MRKSLIKTFTIPALILAVARGAPPTRQTGGGETPHLPAALCPKE